VNSTQKYRKMKSSKSGASYKDRHKLTLLGANTKQVSTLRC
jgi:hypothetical protein